ncbi:MAG: hypothetical protein ACTSVI_16440 [Promethearchaeota archaeon]
MNIGIITSILFGLVGSCTLNLGKAMQKQGIKLFNKSKIESSTRMKKGFIWIIGSAFSFIQPLFQFLGQSMIAGQSATVYSSMFGIGIVVVIIYSYKVLKEEITKIELIGSLLITCGTVIFGIASIYITPPSELTINWTNFTNSMIILIICFVLGALYTLKTKKLWGIIWGVIAGSFGGLDNVFKSISKETNLGDMGFLSGFTSVFMYISFAFGTSAFLLTNYGYTRAKAVTVVPSYSAFYIMIPMILEASFFLIMPSMFQIIGVMISVIGVILSTASKKEENIELYEKNQKSKNNQASLDISD